MSRTDIILERLLRLHPNKLIDLKLDRIERLLAELGRPQDRLPPVIHVAGTNGKGSTIAHLRAFLEAAGKRVHVYTSPHLVNFNERIRLGGKLVSEQMLGEALQTCEEKNAGRPITYFEITTAAAFYLFSRTRADYLLLEVGLGGRFDATNVIEKPLGTMITPISMDHVEFLGHDLASIAREKAGILKKNTPAVIARQPEEAADAIKREAERLGSDIRFAGQDFDFYEQYGRLTYQDSFGLLDLPFSSLKGKFQNQNLALAIAAIRHFELPPDETAIEAGLKNVSWPGRLMELKEGSLVELLDGSQQLWLDGGHNEAAGRALAEALAQMSGAEGKRPLILIVGAYANKDMGAFLGYFKGMAEKIISLEMGGERKSWSTAELAEIARTSGFEAIEAKTIQEAISLAARTVNARIIICGSLHLAGDVLSQNNTPIC